MTRDAARPIVALEREMREITGAALKTYEPALFTSCGKYGDGGASRPSIARRPAGARTGSDAATSRDAGLPASRLPFPLGAPVPADAARVRPMPIRVPVPSRQYRETPARLRRWAAILADPPPLRLRLPWIAGDAAPHTRPSRRVPPFPVHLRLPQICFRRRPDHRRQQPAGSPFRLLRRRSRRASSRAPPPASAHFLGPREWAKSRRYRPPGAVLRNRVRR